MMKRFFVILISCLWLAVPLFAQSNKLIRELESKRGALQKQIAESESILKDTKKDVGSQLNSLAVLTGQIEERKRYIMAINNDVEAIQRELALLERQLHVLVASSLWQFSPVEVPLSSCVSDPVSLGFLPLADVDKWHIHEHIAYADKSAPDSLPKK